MQENHIIETVQHQNSSEAPHLSAGKQSDTAEAAGLHHEAAAAPLRNDAVSTGNPIADPSPSQRLDSQVDEHREAVLNIATVFH